MRVLLLGLVACADDLVRRDPLPVEALDEAFFRCRAQPVITKTCAQLACHGDPERYYVVYSRNRLRMSDLEKERNAFLTDDERLANYLGSVALAVPGDPEGSLLLQKPLDLAVGGRFHRGAELYGGGDVFQDPENDPDWLTLVDWIEGEVEDPACIEPGSEL